MSRVFTLGLILTIASCTAYGMRCSGQIIDEGSSVTRMLELCGDPSYNNLSTIIYMNKDGDGMNYYIHVNEVGMVDAIEYRRGN